MFTFANDSKKLIAHKFFNRTSWIQKIVFSSYLYFTTADVVWYFSCI